MEAMRKMAKALTWSAGSSRRRDASRIVPFDGLDDFTPRGDDQLLRIPDAKAEEGLPAVAAPSSLSKAGARDDTDDAAVVHVTTGSTEAPTESQEMMHHDMESDMDDTERDDIEQDGIAQDGSEGDVTERDDVEEAGDMESDSLGAASGATRVSSPWTVSETFSLSDGDDDEEPVASRRPPSAPGAPRPGRERSELDGDWVLCSTNRKACAWLETLFIDGNLAIDGNGELCPLRRTLRGPTLCGGILRRRGDALVRIGRTGGVLVYLRRSQG